MCLFCMGAYKSNVVVVTKVGAYIHLVGYVLWVLIILILGCVREDFCLALQHVLLTVNFSDNTQKQISCSSMTFYC